MVGSTVILLSAFAPAPGGRGLCAPTAEGRVGRSMSVQVTLPAPAIAFWVTKICAGIALPLDEKPPPTETYTTFLSLGATAMASIGLSFGLKPLAPGTPIVDHLTP